MPPKAPAVQGGGTRGGEGAGAAGGDERGGGGAPPPALPLAQGAAAPQEGAQPPQRSGSPAPEVEGGSPAGNEGGGGSLVQAPSASPSGSPHTSGSSAGDGSSEAEEEGEEDVGSGREAAAASPEQPIDLGTAFMRALSAYYQQRGVELQVGLLGEGGGALGGANCARDRAAPPAPLPLRPPAAVMCAAASLPAPRA